MLIDDSWAFAFALASAIGSITTAVALYFLWGQSRHTLKQIDLTQQQIQLTKQEMESSLRPWIGIGNIGRNDRYCLTVELKNHGSIPAKVVKSHEVFSPTQITQEELRISKNAFGYGYMIFPGSVSTYVSNMNLSHDVQGQDVKFVGILIEYEYGTNKRVQCGFIAQYRSFGGSFLIHEEFSNEM